MARNLYKLELPDMKVRLFDEIAIADSFLDAILWADGYGMGVHRNIMSAASPFFHDLFTSVGNTKRRVICECFHCNLRSDPQ